MKTLLVAALLGVAFAAPVHAQQRGEEPVIRVEPEVQPPAPAAKDDRRRGHGRASRHVPIGLGRPAEAALAALGGQGKRGVPTQVGVPRDVAETGDEARTRAKWTWEPTPEGGRVAALSLVSTGAAALRVGLRLSSLPPGTTLRFYDPAGTDLFEVAGETALEAIAANLEAGERGDDARLYWSPVIEGDEAIVEVELPPGAREADLRLAVPRVSHLAASPRTGFALPQAKAAASCNNDAMCSQAAWGAQMNAVARMVFTSGGSTYVCTGTLLADADPATTIPYFITANHCINTQASASSLVTYWFFRTTACNSGVVGPYQTNTGGAALLYNSTSTDVSFLRLNTSPPAGVTYAGWIATAVPANTSVTAIHHPTGDLLRISFGSVTGFATCTPPVNGQFSCEYTAPSLAGFYEATWRSGITEPGSSGSGLFQDNGKYLVGQLYGGSSSCAYIASGELYGRFDVSYNAGLRNWLGASANVGPAVVPWPGAAMPVGFYSNDAGWSLVNGTAGAETFEGATAVRSNAIAPGASASLLYAASFGAGTVTFARRVSGSGVLAFFVDGVQQAQWSGEVPWAIVSFAIAGGTHTLSWRYDKPAGTAATGADAAWIDGLGLPTNTALTQSLVVTRAGTGGGSVTSVPAGIDCGATCAYAFGQGAFVRVSGAAAVGTRFRGWQGAGCTGAAACGLTMSAPAAVTATFDQVSGTRKRPLLR